MTESKHSLLKRQMKQFFGDNPVPNELKPFMEAVNKAYWDFDADRDMMERSLEFSSQELLQANYEMQAIFEAFPDIFLRIDHEGKIIEFRSAGHSDLVFPSFDRVGKQIQRIAEPSAHEGFAKCIEQVKSQRELSSVEFAISSQGQNKFFEARFIPLTKPEIVVIIRDITDRKVAENELKATLGDLKKAIDDLTSTQGQLIQSEKLASIGQLAAGVAHEINNPVGFINNNMEMLEQYISEYNKILEMAKDLRRVVQQGDVQQAKAAASQMVKYEVAINLDYLIEDSCNLLKHNRKGVERIQKIVLDLRTFAREDKDLMEMVQIEEVIDSILSIVHNELKYKAELLKSYSGTAKVKCNAQRLGQVFINLFVNAAQAMDERGTIEVRTYQQNEFVCVDVRDTGKGIPPENLKRIFDPFFTTKPVGQGTGLGLSVSYEIIKKHDGEIKVQSDPGKGTTFTIMLPVQ